jgi:hypothetical protein
MSISSLFGSSQPTYKFTFGDGKSMPPNEFGKLALKWSLGFGEQFMRDYFEKGKPGWFLSGGSLIEDNPVPAHLYVSILFLASIYAYVDAVLQAPESVSSEVRAAANDGFARMQLPEGHGPDQKVIGHLRGVAEEMYAAVIRDMKNEEASDPRIFRPQPLEATEQLHGLLKNAYAWDSPNVPFLGHSPEQLHLAIELQRALDGAPISLMVTFRDGTKVCLVKA